MPKDATKNIDRYKVRGGELNEFDFHQNQEEFSEQQKARAANLIPGTPPEAKKATQSTRTNKDARSAKATKATKATTATKSTTKASPRGATAKKLAARKASKKK